MQSTFLPSNTFHVAIIMDGNGRWAVERGLPRWAGHRAGADAVRRTVEAATELGVGVLTLYAFSSDNWQRPAREVTALMRLLHRFLRAEVATCVKNGVRLSVIGRRDRLSAPIRYAISRAETKTAGGANLHLRLAIDYSARDSILRAAQRAQQVVDISQASFARFLFEPEQAAPDVDLLIRTGGEQRLSDFLLWESAYAELFFTPQPWPDFGRDDLAAALAEFHRRERRFGQVAA